jgi:hypothetical protein
MRWISAIGKFFTRLWRARRDNGISIGNELHQLVLEYNLEEQVDLNERMQGYTRHWTLIPILPGVEYRWALVRLATSRPLHLLPPEFVHRAQELSRRYERMLRRIYANASVTFSVHPHGMTLEEIHEDQRAWAECCKEYNGDC